LFGNSIDGRWVVLQSLAGQGSQYGMNDDETACREAAVCDKTACKKLRAGLCDWQAKRVSDFIVMKLHSQIRVSDLAAEARMSPGHFSRAFSITFGMSPHAFVMRSRIKHAQHLMCATKSDMAEVAAACGLCDHAHFSRLFRRFVGTPPSIWRTSMAGL